LLNHIAYTGSFSVHAALAGAASTTTVDLSASTARWAEENLERNGVDRGAHRVIALVAPGWDEALDDAALLAVILPGLRPPATP
jgi:methylase of polypeptide subunit release factors